MVSRVHFRPRNRLRRRRCHPKSDLPRSAKTRSGLRFYSAGLGRWLSRDPIGERGGPHLYCHVHNDPCGKVDALGRVPLGGTLPVKITGELRIFLGRMQAEDATVYPGSNCDIDWRPGPGLKALPCCTRVKFLQAVSTVQTFRPKAPIWFTPADGEWHIDGNGFGGIFYGIQDPWETGEPVGTMNDNPGASSWDWTQYLVQKFETCAVCTRGSDAYTVYGCVEWGHRIVGPVSAAADPWPVRRWARHAEASDNRLGSFNYKGTGGPVINLTWGKGLAPSGTWQGLFAPEF